MSQHEDASPRALRAMLRARRRALMPDRQRRHAVAVARLLGRLIKIRNARDIATYWASDGELDPAVIRNVLGASGRRWYLPVIRPFKPARIWFKVYSPGDPLQANRFGIPEPTRGRPVGMRALDLILVPLVGFDADGHRLGMGGGYYDRSLALPTRHSLWRRPLLIGLAHEIQRVERIAAYPWDRVLDAVVTERGIYGTGVLSWSGY